MTPPTDEPATRGRRRQLGLLSVSFFGASGLGLLLIVVVARWLTPVENAHFQAVWGLIFAFASVLGSIEQEVTRRSTAAALDGRRTPVGAAQAIALAAVVCLVLLAALIATPKGQVIVQGSWVVTVLILLSVLNFAGLILARGVLLGSHSLRGYSALLVGEALLRLVLIGVLLLLGVEAAVEWAVFATVVGSLVWIAALGRLAHSIDWSGGRDPWRGIGGTVAALGIANGLSALVLTGFPAVAAVVLGNTADLAVLFAVVTLARTPLVLLAPVQALAVPTVVRWVRRGDTHRLSRALQLIAAGSAAAALLGAAVGYVLGPWAVALVLGAGYRPDPTMAALVAAATCVMAGALLQAAALVALQRYWQLTACWATAIVSAAVLMLMAPWEAEQRGLGGFTLASVVAFVATALAVRRTVATAGGHHEQRAH